MHCVRKDCEYWVGKYKSLDPGGGVLSSLIKALFLLQWCILISDMKHIIDKGQTPF